MEYLFLLKNIHIMLVVQANEVEFNFSTGSIGSGSSTELGYELSGSDEFGVVGKFKEL